MLKPYLFLYRSLLRKREDIFAALQIVVVITLILSSLMYLAERHASPDDFGSVVHAITWSVSQYIGGIGGYGDYQPQTQAGKVLATFIGLMALAIIAIPAGLLASGFVEEMEEEKKRVRDESNRALLERVMEKYRPNNAHYRLLQTYPRFMDLAWIRCQLALTDADIHSAVRRSSRLRLRPKKKDPNVNIFDAVALEYHQNNQPYGCRIDGAAPVLIVNPLGLTEQGLSHFSWVVAQELINPRAHYISNEFFAGTALDPSRVCDFRKTMHEQPRPEYVAFKRDLVEATRQCSWVIVFDACKADRDHAVSVVFGGEKGQSGLDFPRSTVGDTERLRIFLEQLKTGLSTRAGMKLGTHEEFGRFADHDIVHYLHTELGVNSLRIYISAGILGGPDKLYFAAAEALADALQSTLCATA